MARRHRLAPARLGRPDPVRLTVGDLYFVTGGARSGKSSFAERLAADSGLDVIYIATMVPGDEELRDRVDRHRAQRPAGWATIEAPTEITKALRGAPDDACVLVDCLSLWVTNALLALDDEDPGVEAVSALEARLDLEVEALVGAVAARGGPVIAVTNEVGSGLVPAYPLGRVYRDLLGRVNQRVSRAADRAWLLVSGRALELPPVE
jgi:adenosylcobinamide kinase / adenosylcobinamide-phosphate guanylyltransferase